MRKENLKKYSLKAFAFTLFCSSLYYILNAGTTSEIFSPFPGRIVIVYFTAFVDFAIASSIVANIYVGKVCYWGGIYCAFITVVTFLAGMLSDRSNANYYLLSFNLSIGFTAAILYIASEAED